MRKLILPLLVMVVGLGSCNMANDDDYKNVADDMCNCVNKNVTGLSKEFKEIYSKYGAGDQATLEAKMQEYMMNDFEGAMKDMGQMEQVGAKIETCMKDSKKKYKELYTSDNEKEVQNKVLKELKDAKGCELSYALFSMGMKAGK